MIVTANDQEIFVRENFSIRRLLAIIDILRCLSTPVSTSLLVRVIEHHRPVFMVLVLSVPSQYWESVMESFPGYRTHMHCFQL